MPTYISSPSLFLVVGSWMTGLRGLYSSAVWHVSLGYVVQSANGVAATSPWCESTLNSKIISNYGPFSCTGVK